MSRINIQDLQFHPNPDIRIIVATDNRGGFSKGGKIPWHIPDDLAHFRQITTQTEQQSNKNAVIMGKKTFETTGVLKNRINIVLSHTPVYTEYKREELGTIYSSDNLKGAVNLATELKCPTIFVIGGEQPYIDALANLPVNTVYRTRIDGHYFCDRFFPDLSESPFTLIESKYGGSCGTTGYWFETWKRTE